MLNLLENHKYSDIFVDLVSFTNASKLVFKEFSPDKFDMYCGNCCRQIAVLSCMFLSKHIPEYDWRIYESSFTCDRGEFEHSWCFGSINGSPYGIFVDLAYSNGLIDNFLFEGLNDFPEDIALIDIGCVENRFNRMIIPIDHYLYDKEFYTGMICVDLFDYISDKI